MAGTSAAILSVGMATPVGIGTPQAAAAVRAGIARFRESDYHDRNLEPIVCANLPEEALPEAHPTITDLPGISSREQRMLRLASLALTEATAPVSSAGPVPLFLGLPESLLGSPAHEPPEEFARRLALQAGVAIDLDKSRVFTKGRASGLFALGEALEHLGSGQSPMVVVGGVDTYLDQDLLSRLDGEGRISSADNLDGFIPGEGAGFLAIGTEKTAIALGRGPMAWVGGVGLGFEKGHLASDQVYRGEGLAEALQNLFSSGLPKKGRVHCVFCTLNGEYLGAKEWGVAYLRHRERFEEDHLILHPADSFGDAGAAMAPLLLGLAAEGLKRGYRRGPCLVWCSSDYGDRGATLVWKSQEREGR